MRITPTFRLDQQAFRRAIARRIATGRKAAGEVVTQAAKGVLKTSIKHTPPASAQRTGRDAKRQGEAAIVRDLQRVFEPVDLKGTREETHPDVRALYLSHRQSRGNRWSVRLPGKAKFYVDRRKMTALMKELWKGVGALGAAFAPAAKALGVTLPAWMKRHGEGRGGRIKIRITNTAHPYIEVTAKMPNARIAADVQRRVDWAVAEETRKMDRQWQNYLKRQQERINGQAA